MKSDTKLMIGFCLIVFTLMTLFVWCVSVFSYLHAPIPSLYEILFVSNWLYSFIVFILLAYGMRFLLGSFPSKKKKAIVSIISSGIFLVFSIFINLIILNRYYDQLPDYSYPASLPGYTFSPLIGIYSLSICLVIYGIIRFFKREPKVRSLHKDANQVLNYIKEVLEMDSNQKKKKKKFYFFSWKWV